MEYIFLTVFAIFSVIHLYASLKKNRQIRNVTKGFILYSLLAFYIISLNRQGYSPSLFVIIAIITSWLGDMFLIPNGIKWFTAGGIFFMISHMFFIIAYNEYIDFEFVPLWFVISLAIVYIIIVSLLFIKLKQHLPKALFPPMYMYLLLNGGMNCFAFYRLLYDPTFSSIITAIGAILFFVSDSTLFFVRFNKNCLIKTHFLVMLTYTIGEFLIILGFIVH